MKNDLIHDAQLIVSIGWKMYKAGLMAEMVYMESTEEGRERALKAYAYDCVYGTNEASKQKEDEVKQDES